MLGAFLERLNRDAVLAGAVALVLSPVSLVLANSIYLPWMISALSLFLAFGFAVFAILQGTIARRPRAVGLGILSIVIFLCFANATRSDAGQATDRIAVAHLRTIAMAEYTHADGAKAHQATIPRLKCQSSSTGNLIRLAHKGRRHETRLLRAACFLLFCPRLRRRRHHHILATCYR